MCAWCLKGDLRTRVSGGIVVVDIVGLVHERHFQLFLDHSKVLYIYVNEYELQWSSQSTIYSYTYYTKATAIRRLQSALVGYPVCQVARPITEAFQIVTPSITCTADTHMRENNTTATDFDDQLLCHSELSRRNRQGSSSFTSR
jgi:hypothetical protein